jgi:hypothetical protein
MSISQAVEQTKSWAGPVLGFVGAVIKEVAEHGIEWSRVFETFVYGACGAAGVLVVQELYKYVKSKLVKQINKEDVKVD